MIRRFYLALSFFFLIATYLSAQYNPDVLGNGYSCRTFQMPDDYAGKVVCSLVKKTATENSNKAILYIHGYNDYFFQKELGDSIAAHGYNFYALDLRKYGRSILPHQDPFSCKSLKEYFADIDTALCNIRIEGNEHIVIMAHSTGGLISAYYLNERPHATYVNGLILNSPFLDWNFGWLMEEIVFPSVSFIGRFFPELTVQGKGSPSCYAYSLLKKFKGEWNYNTDWKMICGHPKKAGWIRAIQTAQQEIQKESKINCPILVLSSDRSFPESEEWHEEYMISDIVLDVKDIRKYGAKLGERVTCQKIKHGMHDLILSEKEARKQAYEQYFNWLRQLESLDIPF